MTASTLSLGAFLLVGGRAGDLYGRRRALVAGGMVAGLVLGGVLTASLGWPWCFFLVVPFGLAAAALAPAVLEESRDEQAPRPDLPGAALCAAGCGMLVFGLVRIERDGVAAAPFLVAAVLLLAAFLVVERRAATPMVRPAILRHRPLAGANLAIIANAGGFTGMTFMATLYACGTSLSVVDRAWSSVISSTMLA